jgi:hypothetical protein
VSPRGKTTINNPSLPAADHSFSSSHPSLSTNEQSIITPATIAGAGSPSKYSQPRRTKTAARTMPEPNAVTAPAPVYESTCKFCLKGFIRIYGAPRHEELSCRSNPGSVASVKAAAPANAAVQGGGGTAANSNRNAGIVPPSKNPASTGISTTQHLPPPVPPPPPPLFLDTSSSLPSPSPLLNLPHLHTRPNPRSSRSARPLHV